MPDFVISSVYHSIEDDLKPLTYIDVYGDTNRLFWVPVPVAKEVQIAEDIWRAWEIHGLMM